MAASLDDLLTSKHRLTIEVEVDDEDGGEHLSQLRRSLAALVDPSNLGAFEVLANPEGESRVGAFEVSTSYERPRSRLRAAALLKLDTGHWPDMEPSQRSWASSCSRSSQRTRRPRLRQWRRGGSARHLLGQPSLARALRLPARGPPSADDGEGEEGEEEQEMEAAPPTVAQLRHDGRVVQVPKARAPLPHRSRRQGGPSSKAGAGASAGADADGGGGSGGGGGSNSARQLSDGSALASNRSSTRHPARLRAVGVERRASPRACRAGAARSANRPHSSLRGDNAATSTPSVG